MRIGMMIGDGSGSSPGLDGLVERARALEAKGFDTVWMANIFSFDAIGALGIVGHETRRIELGTAVVPTYPRHPVAMAQQALTAQAACRGRFVLGIGLSHQIVIENMLGLSYERRASHMREYLEVLGPLLRGEPAAWKGEEYRVHGRRSGARRDAGAGAGRRARPAMLALAGPTRGRHDHLDDRAEDARGAHVPTLTRARPRGRARPRRASSRRCRSCWCATPRRRARRPRKVFEIYGQLPSYRAMLDREGAAGPADVAIVGDERSARRGAPRARGRRRHGLLRRRLRGRAGLHRAHHGLPRVPPVGGPLESVTKRVSR